MAGSERIFRPKLHHNYSSASLRGLEIAIPPGELYPRSSQSLGFLCQDKELPLVPREDSTRRRSKTPRKLSDTYKVVFGDGPYAEMGCKMSEDTAYRDELSEASFVMNHRLDVHHPNVDSSESEKVHNVRQDPCQLAGQDGIQVQYHQQWSEIASPTHWDVDKGMGWSSSSSCYSHEDDSRPANHLGSWLGVNSAEDVSPEIPRGLFYLQPKTYSASITKMDPKASSVAEEPSITSVSVRHRERPLLSVIVSATPPARSQTEQPPRAPIPPTPHKAMTLDDMISYERQRFETEEFSQDIWRFNHDLPLPQARTAPKIPARGQHPPGSRYESIPTLLPQPLTLRQRRGSNRESVSHFSDHSLDEGEVDATSKLFSQARSSVLSHIRKISTATTKHSKTMLVQMQPPSPKPPKPTKRKRISSNTHHSLRSPYPPQAMRISAASAHAPEHDAPIWPPPADARTPSLSRRLSPIIRKPSLTPPAPQSLSPESAAPAQMQSERPSIITNYARVASGPDTPLPASDKARFISTLDPILHKGKGVVAQVRQGVRVRSAAEMRRDKLRKEIVLIGPADQYPDGRVNNWF